MVAVMVSLADTWERSWDTGDTWLQPNDPEFAERIGRDYASFRERVVSAGAAFAWVRPPTVLDLSDRGREYGPERSYADGSQELIESVIRGLSSANDPDSVIDLRSYFASAGLDQDLRLRPDGIHLTESASELVARSWLGPELVCALGSLDGPGKGQSRPPAEFTECQSDASP